MKVYYFGCWKVPGHFLFGPHGSHVSHDERENVVYYGDHAHLDGTLAPRRTRDGKITWAGVGKTREQRERVRYATSECEQGQALLHHLDNGYTAVQWWDRTQGDTRGACNSTFLAEGAHDFAYMLRLFTENFPEQHARITAVTPITLVEVK